MKRCAVVIPAYNEENTIRSVVERALRQTDTVIVVDDASTDATARIVAELPAVLLRHPSNRGKAAALTSGFEKARDLGADYAITLDGDGQHAPEDFPRFLAAAAKYRDRPVVGARLYNRAQAPLARRFANRFADFWVGWAAGSPMADSQCGFRLYPLDLVEALAVNTRYGFVFESEFLIEASRNGFPPVFIPIRSEYPPNRRPSHFRPLLDIARITAMVALKLLAWGLYPEGLYRSLSEAPLIHRDEA